MSEWTPREKRQIDRTAEQIYSLLRGMTTPRAAACALSIAHGRLCAEGGAEAHAQVKAMLDDSNKATMTAWAAFPGQPDLQ